MSGRKEVVEILIQNGGDIHSKDVRTLTLSCVFVCVFCVCDDVRAHRERESLRDIESKEKTERRGMREEKVREDKDQKGKMKREISLKV